MNTGGLFLAPLLPWPLLAALGGLSLAAAGLALWRGLGGWWLRALAALVVMAGLLGPSWQRERREPLDDVALVVVDRSASQGLPGRRAQTEAALAALASALKRPGLETRIVELGDDPEDRGTRLMERLNEALAELPTERLAGVILISDGLAHDADAAPPALPAPMHLLLTGRSRDWDRQLKLQSSPTFAILGEPVQIGLRIEDSGALPPSAGGTGEAELAISLDGGPARRIRVPVGQDVRIPVALEHAGVNVVQLSVPEAAGELTTLNNSAVLRINGVRDRLRVLLVSGEPYAGERTWRNLLKADSAVDLVHFTILRSPDKQDLATVNELSLIAFPTQELFQDKIDQFDLIIFDRYTLRGILPASYLDNVRRYILEGGAVLVAAGPDYAGVGSLFRSPLGQVLPAAPTSRLIEEGFRPRITALGARHPVTAGLEALARKRRAARPGAGAQGTEAGTGASGSDGASGNAAPEAPPGTSADTPPWGRWFRQVEVSPLSGDVLMEGAQSRPLLLLDRVGEGRVALLASDQAWLWSRGFEGGGPQAELLRRLAHWLMKEPELEEEALDARLEGGALIVTRRSLTEGPRRLEITDPEGEAGSAEMKEESPGRFVARIEQPRMGLYRLREGDLKAVIAVGAIAPREFERTIATGALLDAPIEATGGGVRRLEEGMPALRMVSPGRIAHGRGWLGLTPRGAYRTTDIQLLPLAPPWLMLLLGALLMLLAWLREGRQGAGRQGAGREGDIPRA